MGAILFLMGSHFSAMILFYLFFVLFLEGFKEIAVGTEAVLTGDGVFENSFFKRHKSKCHVGTEENEGADSGEIRGNERERRQVDNGEKTRLSQNDGDEKGKDIDREEGLLRNSSVRIKDKRNKESKDGEGSKLSGEIVGAATIKITIDKRPDKSGSNSNFDMLPSRFVDGGEKAKNFIFAT